MNPLVSIIIPVYNSEKYIRDTLQSCIEQSYTNLEIIVVNDGSQDRSEEIIESLRDNRIRYFKIPNSGPCVARNFGIRMATGDLFQFLDADDILHRDKLKLQVERYERYGEEYVYSGVMGNIIGTQKQLEKGFDFYYTNLEVPEYFRRMFANFGKYYTTGMWLVSRKLVEETGEWDSQVLLNNDGEYFARLILNSDGLIFCPGAIFYYRRDVPGSVSKKNSRKIYESWLYSYNSYVKNFRRNLDDRSARELGRKALSVYYCNSYPFYPDLLQKCRDQIKELGYPSPSPHGGRIFRILSAFIGTENALKLRTLKKSNKLSLESLFNLG